MKTKKKPTAAKRYDGFSAAEKSAMKSRVSEMKSGDAADEGDVLAKIDEMPQPDRDSAHRFHAMIKRVAPSLTPRLYYGMPAYAKDGKSVCWYKTAAKFKSRYATIEFSDQAKLDDGTMWPVSYALPKLTAADEARLEALVRKAVG
ncbi:MAG TPA: hypothetical protein VFB69_02340 [Candidatus Dormibacteraeota bacterium]|nr:hypothetical protein [Candidatus Dormibacteraeota bacterium]